MTIPDEKTIFPFFRADLPLAIFKNCQGLRNTVANVSFRPPWQNGYETPVDSAETVHTVTRAHFWSIVINRCTHFEDNFFLFIYAGEKYVPVLSRYRQAISHPNSPTTISSILLMTSGVMTIACAHIDTQKTLEPFINSSNRDSRYAIIIIKILFCLPQNNYKKRSLIVFCANF